MAQEMDILYERDSSKIKLPRFHTARIEKNEQAIPDQLSPIGDLGQIDKDDSFYLNIESYVHDAYDPSHAEVPLNQDSDQFSFKKFHAIEQPSNLPKGLVCSVNDDGIEITGNVYEITSYQYEFLLRVTLETWSKDWQTLIRVDVYERYFYFTTKITKDTFYWDENWLEGQMTQTIEGQSVYYLGSWPKGVNINIPMILYNPNGIKVTYSVQPTGFSNGLVSNDPILPKGIKIDTKSGNIGGSISISNNAGKYLFKAVVSNGNNAGNPPTNSVIFLIAVQEVVSTKATPDNSITWITPAGDLGTSYSTYPAHFQVQAKNPSGKEVEYSIAPNGFPLPGNLSIDPQTGMLIGDCPDVDVPTTFNFVARASLDVNYVDRSFSFTVLPLYGSGNHMSVNIPITEKIREDITSWAWDIEAIPEDFIYRPFDQHFGRTKQPLVLLASGLNANTNTIGYWYDNPDNKGGNEPKNGTFSDEPDLSASKEEHWHSCFVDKLRGYHRPFDLRIGKINWAPAYDPVGNYIYDVVYFELFDPNKDQIAFTNGNENIYSNPTNSLNNQSFGADLNMEHSYFQVPNSHTSREYPVCLMNCRLDLITTKNRVKSPTYYKAPRATPGIGIDGKEGLPFWMMNSPSPDQSISPVGWKPVIPLVYVKPEKGIVASVNLKQRGAERNITGSQFTVDRYILDIAIHKWIIWDPWMDPTTTFDNQKRPWINQTLFDVRSEYKEQVILFPRIGTD